MELTEAELEQRRQAARKHGIRAFETRGEDALLPAQITRLAELRLQLRDAPGRMELRQELTARMALIVEIGFAHIAEQRARGEDIWEGGIIKRYGTYAAELRRLLDSFGDKPEQGSAADEILEAMNHDRNS